MINKNKEKGMSHNKAAIKADGTRLAQAIDAKRMR